MPSLNNLSDHAPKPEWLRDFFDNPEDFLQHNQLGSMQISHLRRFLYDAELVSRKTKIPTEFTTLIKKIGWNTATAWGLILVNLVYNPPQIRWYVENFPLNERIARASVEEKLQALEVSAKDSRSIVKAFKRLCEIPLGTELKFGTTTSDGKNISTLKRTKARVDDSRVILYALYRFAEATIFGINREEMQQLLNGLSTNYPDFIDATFTHDLEKISLAAEKTSQDILILFEGDGVGL